MGIVFKKALPRRTLLRGMGAAVALPLLDGMIPAFAGPSDTTPKPPCRFAVAYVPNGMWPMDRWTPKTEGSNFELSPTLEAFAPVKDQILVLSGLSHNEAMPKENEQGGDHTWAVTTYLSGVRPKRTAGKDLRLGITMDQIAAQEVGKNTRLGSLEVSLLSHPIAGTCEPGFSCAYVGTLSWRGPTTPLPMEHHPRAVFERLFGDTDTSDAAARRARLNEKSSLLDLVTEEVAQLAKGLGPSDRGKLNEYLDAVRDVEKRIRNAEEQSAREVPSFDRPAGVPASLTDYSNLMVDLQVLAFQADLTRVITFMIGRDGPYGSRAYPEIGVPDTHHSLSHHQNDQEKIEKLFLINNYHAKLMSYFLQKLKAAKDGDGTLLDHSIILYGGGMSNGNGHVHTDLPMLLAGGGNGTIKGGRHIRYPKDTQMTNLHLTLLDKLGVHIDKLGNSTGALDLGSV